MIIWPSKYQWQRWSLPSKLTAIGALVSVMSLSFYFLEKIVEIAKPDVQEKKYRPYISIASISLSDIVLLPGPIVIRWDIKNNGNLPAKIAESNMTLWFETEDLKLPDTPKYVPTPHKLTGITINPGDTFNATFTSYKTLVQSEVGAINNFISKLYIFGFVKYSDENNGHWCKGFIARYQPLNNLHFGMFANVEEDYRKYSCDK